MDKHIIVLSITGGCMLVYLMCMILFFWIGDYPRAIMMTVALILIGILLKPTVTKILRNLKGS